MMVANLTVFSFALGQIAVTVMEQDAQLVVVRQKISSVETLIATRKLPPDLAGEIRKMFEFSVKDRDDDATHVQSSLPHSLKVEVARFVCRGLVSNVALFRECHERFHDSLSVLLHETTYLQEVYIFYTNEVSVELYIVARGEILITIAQPGGEEEVTGVKQARAQPGLLGSAPPARE